MPIDLILKPSCGVCGSAAELYGSTCKHLTLCLNCGNYMAEKRSKCYECGTPITRLIREYAVRASSSNNKNYFIGRFASGLPNFKKNEKKWSLQKESLQGRHMTDALREKFKNEPWLLEDETKQFQYHGHLEGTQATTYYLLMLQGKEIVAIPAGSWYNFSKVVQCKQLTLEEAEEKMKNRRRSADGYQRWMMKSARNGAAAFGEVEKFDKWEGAAGGRRKRKKSTGYDDEANVSDRGEEDEDDEAARKNRLGLNKKNGDDDEEGSRGGDLDFDDDNIKKGDDWEHEEIFTDDDEAVGIDHEEREDLAPEIPAPPESKQQPSKKSKCEQGNGVMKCYWDFGKLTLDDKFRFFFVILSFEMMEDDTSPVVIPKKEAPKEEPVDDKATTSAAGRGTPPTSKSSKAKRKEGSKTPNNRHLKKVKTENLVYSVETSIGIQGLKPVKDENASSSKSVASSQSRPPQPTGLVTEGEIRAFMLQRTQVTTQDLSDQFKSRLMLQEERGAFSAIMKRISKIQKKTEGGPGFLRLRERDNLM
ncbi:transcription initiation factor IIF subunit alpha RAP74 [Perilla frutescens var. hirtella]|uniref:Transcription initiation factor IIF subunit alpha n=1 Tax=Perilla frutescens var. hirtella TaxID=608512 RepID=A0AAD4PF78_PERFH|nr:transcription initiation factor IIF subunit alpha RAP74 [Perilla frutescens var. hirtella]